MMSGLIPGMKSKDLRNVHRIFTFMRKGQTKWISGLTVLRSKRNHNFSLPTISVMKKSESSSRFNVYMNAAVMSKHCWNNKVVLL